MKIMKHSKSALTTSVLALFVCASSLTACDSEENPGPSAPPVVDDGSPDGGEDTATSTSTATDDEGADGGTSSTDDETDTATDDETDTSTSTDDEPVTDVDGGTEPPTDVDGGTTQEPPEEEGGVTPPEEEGGVTVPEEGGVTLPEEGGTEPSDCAQNPDTNEEFLNQCNNSQCAAFDNVGRLGLYVEGEPLPEPL